MEQEQRTSEEEGHLSVDTLLCTCTYSVACTNTLVLVQAIPASSSTAYMSVSALFTFGVACALVAKAFFHAGRAGERSKEQRTALLSSLSICTHK